MDLQYCIVECVPAPSEAREDTAKSNAAFQLSFRSPPPITLHLVYPNVAAVKSDATYGYGESRPVFVE